jgi:ubiquinol-cytochrome c reductase iron-sulfur subunit
MTDLDRTTTGGDGGDGREGGDSGDGVADAERAAAARRGERVELGSAFAFLVALGSAITLAIVYWLGGQPQAEGILLAATLGGIGVGIVLWAKHFMPNDEVTEERESVESSEEDIDAFTADFEAGESTLRSRRLLVATAGGACAALGVALLFPIRSLGPRPGRGLKETPYKNAPIRVVTENGEPVKPEDLPIDGFVTAWPEGFTDAADASTLLIHFRDDQNFRPHIGRRDWTVNNIVAYSKLCTHVGCPVGLYQAEQGLLLCPCHQSTFNVMRWATPIFGPATRSLPQLPLDLDDDGFIIATADFSGPVGPGFWDRDRK